MKTIEFFHDPRKGFVVITAAEPVVYSNLKQASLTCKGTGSVKLVNCNILHFECDGSAEIVNSTVKSVSVAKNLLLRNSKIIDAKSRADVCVIGEAVLKTLKARSVYYLNSSNNGDQMSSAEVNGSRAYIQKTARCQQCIFGNL